MDCQLTVIITFKNEGNEVFCTLKSLGEKSLSQYETILINDSSDDGYDYDSLKEKFDCIYIKHNLTKGPAISRQEGIGLCKTKYFLLLDAHMRAETIGWDSYIINAINRDPNGLYCCLTDKLICDKNSECIASDSTGGGVVLDLESLSYKWINYRSSSDDISQIPCLMGASYCGNKEYWNRIHGLVGLKSYGFEEQLISLKTYMEGGKCYVINVIRFAHKFKTSKNVTFKPNIVSYIYNKLYIVELLYPLRLKIPAFQKVKRLTDSQTFNLAMQEFFINRELIWEEKKYMAKILSKDFSTFVEFNNMFNKKDFYEKENEPNIRK